MYEEAVIGDFFWSILILVLAQILGGQMGGGKEFGSASVPKINIHSSNLFYM